MRKLTASQKVIYWLVWTILFLGGLSLVKVLLDFLI
jgi:hypothetical protein